jgi:hypothetical protein
VRAIPCSGRLECDPKGSMAFFAEQVLVSASGGIHKNPKDLKRARQTHMAGREGGLFVKACPSRVLGWVRLRTKISGLLC